METDLETDPKTSIHKSLGYWVSLLSRTMEAEFSRHLAPHGLTRMSYAVLAAMAFGGHVTPSGIADSIGVDRAAVTRLLDKLEAQELIARARDKRDRRSIVLQVLPRGEALAKEMQECSRAVNANFTEALTRDEVDRFVELAKAMLQDTRVRPKNL
ncbi:MarR family transcriptional regulator [Aliiroseovarius sp. M344]|uniref:MarR family winged helix-turn-helix transcriptional regulator n=1 Tax=Aliiroseovarius sp. M344 TaxID=2867010 RepID=UPI0021ADECEF|nr:MarR family transcriptional regulator [Aliiroseovarius sp. M344]UWQ14735.1 MarR family transcriptional regulator [Aliiroseovarius sp. M344]